MIFDLQKASILKRFSAWLLDLILLVIFVVGLSGAVSGVIGFDSYSQRLEAHYSRYEKEYGVVFDITQEEYAAMSQEEKDNYDAAYQALIDDEDAMYDYSMSVNLTLVMVTLGILVAYLLLEFLVPMLLGNGQTLGKKVFGIALMRTSGVKINGVCLFIRTLLGKCTVETMIPVLVVLMLMFNVTGNLGTLLVLALLIAQIILLCVTRNRSAIHDLMADTVAVDFATQMIFKTEEEMLEYKKRVSAEKAKEQAYF